MYTKHDSRNDLENSKNLRPQRTRRQKVANGFKIWSARHRMSEFGIGGREWALNGSPI